MNSKELVITVKSLNLPPDQYLVVGSGPMVVRNLREGQDIDLVTKPELLSTLAKKYPSKEENGLTKIDLGQDVELTSDGIFNNSSVIPLEEMFAQKDLIEDIPFLNLEQLIVFKQKLGREKDIKDIELIEKYLTSR